MKERPILFSAPMVRAILEGRKTQTRRVFKENPMDGPVDAIFPDGSGKGFITWWGERLPTAEETVKLYPGEEGIRCLFGISGDRLWVKESHFLHGHWEMEGKTKITDKDKWRFCPNKTYGVNYFDSPPPLVRPNSYRGPAWYKRNSLFMPRWASRINLEITGIGVERLNDISEKGAIAEGIEREFAHGEDIGWKNYLWHGHFGQYGMGNRKSDAWEHQYSTYESAVGCYSSLWELINGHGSWAENPWVWVIEFKRVFV